MCGLGGGGARVGVNVCGLVGGGARVGVNVCGLGGGGARVGELSCVETTPKSHHYEDDLSDPYLDPDLGVLSGGRLSPITPGGGGGYHPLSLLIGRAPRSSIIPFVR